MQFVRIYCCSHKWFKQYIGYNASFSDGPYFVPVYFLQLFRAALENTVCLSGAWL